MPPRRHKLCDEQCAILATYAAQKKLAKTYLSKWYTADFDSNSELRAPTARESWSWHDEVTLVEHTIANNNETPSQEQPSLRTLAATYQEVSSLQSERDRLQAYEEEIRAELRTTQQERDNLQREWGKPEKEHDDLQQQLQAFNATYRA
ncbi:hypothetical protein GX50_07521 [[Emmonsia] crescens]|uniref:Uncharacterized protein n=1 Tax=[Emmonsia] crescens TaxID=73230 RepID=A0A2B7Z9C2_9EURO|nr:hypothetical protein GX50_07521 [Emmonsia crescens]